MNVILIVIIVFLLIRTITLKLTLGAIKVYLKEIGRYPTSEERLKRQGKERSSNVLERKTMDRIKLIKL